MFNFGEDGVAILEVKDGEHDGELVRGVYQAVEYRALMMAEKGRGEAYSVKAFLAAHKMPDYVKQFGSRFDIDCRQVSLPQ